MCLLLVLAALISCSEETSVGSEGAKSQDQLQLEKAFAFSGMTTYEFPLEESEQKEDSIYFIGMVLLYSGMVSKLLEEAGSKNFIPKVLKQIQSSNADFLLEFFNESGLRVPLKEGKYDKEDILLLANGLIAVLKMIQNRLSASLASAESKRLTSNITSLEEFYKAIEAGEEIDLEGEKYKAVTRKVQLDVIGAKFTEDEPQDNSNDPSEFFFATLMANTSLMAAGALVAAVSVSDSKVFDGPDATTPEKVLVEVAFSKAMMFLGMLGSVPDRMKDVLTAGEKTFVSTVVDQYEEIFKDYCKELEESVTECQDV
ncbi:MAG: hypothetical protein OXC44_06750 [Proteobacteria bacterium]|nr:hypothetical protein [Pseudomonadota bacterium]